MLITGEEPDMIMITEVIPKAQVHPIPLSLLALPGYTVYLSFDNLKPNLGTSGQRGACIYVLDSLQVSEIYFPGNRFPEQVWIKMKLAGQNTLHAGCIYRSPTASEENFEELCKLIKEASQGGSTHFLVAGDFNLGSIDWDSGFSTAPSSHISHVFIEAIRDAYLIQHVHSPTRYRHGTTPSLLDLVFSNEEHMVTNLTSLPGLGSSDHVVLKFCFKCFTGHRNSLSPKLALNRGNYQLMSEMVNEVPWGSMEEMSTAECYEFISSNLERITNACVPKQVSRAVKKNMYMTNEAMSMKKQKSKLWRTYTRTQNILDHGRYARIRDRLRALTRKLRREYEEKLTAELKTNVKGFWRYVNSRRKTKSRIDDLQKQDGTMASTDAEKAQLLSDFFSSVFTRENCSEIPRLPTHWNGLICESIDLTPELVEGKLRALRPSSSPGPDGVHPRILREIATPVSLALCSLFQKSVESGQIPEAWKDAEVVPIYKKGRRQDPANYRPISLTSVPSKVLESLIRDRLMEHMAETSQLSDDQHGFRAKRSCISQLLATIEDWTRAIEDGSPVDAAYLDFRKAFDSVPHKRLLQKLSDLGVRGAILRWVESFLTGRRQRVVLCGEKSQWAPVLSGIPQGSVLGPTLFVLYINDLPQSVQSLIKLFADDAKLYCCDQSQASRLQMQADLDAMSEWSTKWLLPFNEAKCKTLHLGPRNIHQQYMLNNTMLEQVRSEKDLGVIVDEDLKFREQAASAASKGNQILGLIKRSFANIDTKTLPLLYKTLVRPLLEYGNPIWGPFNKHDQVLIEKVQRRATRLVPEFRHQDRLPYQDRLRTLKLPSLLYRRRRGDMIMMYKLMTGQLGLNKEDFVADPTSNSTRGHSLKLAKPRAHSRVRRNHLPVRAVDDWNSLPDAIVRSTTTNQFKNQLDKHWVELQYDIP